MEVQVSDRMGCAARGRERVKDNTSVNDATSIRLQVRPDSPMKSEADQALLRAADKIAMSLFNNELADLYSSPLEIRTFLRAWLAWKDERL